MSKANETENNKSTTNKKETSPKVDTTPKASAQSDANTKKVKPVDQTKVRQFNISVNLNQLGNRVLLLVFVGVLFLPFLFRLAGWGNDNIISLSQAINDIRDKKVAKVQIAGDELQLQYQDKSEKTARKEDGQELLNVLDKSGLDLKSVEVEVKNLTFWDIAGRLLVNILPLIFMAILFLFLFAQARGAQDGIMGFGRSKAKLFVKGKQDIKFAQVGGMDEAKKELEEVVDFMRDPKKYKKLGARTPKGVLLVGPSGTGKTLLARAVAGEANVQFLSMAGSEFMEMLVGVGASRVRDLFDTAKKAAPSIIFIDEIDAIGRVRGMGSMGGHDEREQTLNQILVEMDGFTQNDNVIVMAATNRGDLLDPALVRPGRFDRRVQLNLPDLKERQFILGIHAKGKTFTPDIDWEKIAKQTVGFSGADLENMLNEAAIAAARANKEAIGMPEIEEAALKVKLGPTKKRLVDESERQMTAYHEAGHALIAHLLPGADPVQRISILSRGNALGFTFTPPDKDRLQVTKSELMDQIAVCLGGRAAEQLIFNELTAGASADIAQATRLARAMVVDYGMSELGPVNFAPQYEGSNYSRAWMEPAKISDRIQEKVDEAISQIIAQAQKQATQILTQQKVILTKISNQLLATETLDADEFANLVGSPKVSRHQNTVK